MKTIINILIWNELVILKIRWLEQARWEGVKHYFQGVNTIFIITPIEEIQLKNENEKEKKRNDFDLEYIDWIKGFDLLHT